MFPLEMPEVSALRRVEDHGATITAKKDGARAVGKRRDGDTSKSHFPPRWKPAKSAGFPLPPAPDTTGEY